MVFLFVTKHAFASLAQNDGNHWGPCPEYIAGVVTLLTPVDPLSLESDV